MRMEQVKRSTQCTVLKIKSILILISPPITNSCYYIFSSIVSFDSNSSLMHARGVLNLIHMQMTMIENKTKQKNEMRWKKTHQFESSVWNLNHVCFREWKITRASNPIFKEWNPLSLSPLVVSFILLLVLWNGLLISNKTHGTINEMP